MSTNTPQDSGVSAPMPSETLLPCPFCGGTAELWRAHPGDAVLPKLTAFVGCMGECATVVTRGFETDAEAIATWNRRAAHQERDADDYPAWFAQLTRVTAVICWRCRSVEYVEGDFFALGKATCDECGEKTYALPAVFRPKECDADARRLTDEELSDVLRAVGETFGVEYEARIRAKLAPDTQTAGGGNAAE